MRLEQQITHPRLLRKPIRGDGPSTAGLRGEVDADKASRFVDATLLDQPRRAAIIQALGERQIGDELGREIFIGAVEYQLTAYAHDLGPKASADPDPGLRAAAAQAQGIAVLLGRLPEAARRLLAERLMSQDAPRLDAGQDLLCELGCEINHLAQACRLAAESPPPASGTELGLIRQLARAFAACFEETATAAADGGFATALRVLAEKTGLAIPHAPALLSRALSSPAAEADAGMPKGRVQTETPVAGSTHSVGVPILAGRGPIGV